MFAVGFWILGVGCCKAIWSEPRSLFEDEPNLPLVVCLLPLGGMLLGVASASGVAGSLRGEGLRRFLTILAIVSVAILSAVNLVAIFLGLHQLG